MIINAVIKQGIASLINSTSQMDPEQAKEQFAQGLADIIESAIKSATVTVNAGIPVSAPPPSGIGATTGPGTGSLS